MQLETTPITRASSTIATCKHCQSPLSSRSDEAGHEFCCLGCKIVYQTLLRSGLGEYYEIQKDGLCFKPAQPVKSLLSQEDTAEWRQPTLSFKIYVEGIHCTACVWLLEKLPWVLPEVVESVSLNLSDSTLTVKTQPGARFEAFDQIPIQLKSWGYIPHLIHSDEEKENQLKNENRSRLIELGIAGALAGNVMLMSIPLYAGVQGSFQTLFEWLSFLLSIPALVYSARSFFKNVWVGIKHKIFPIDAPILLAIVVAFIYSVVSLLLKTHQLYFDSLTALIFLLLASRTYLARLRQHSSLRSLNLENNRGVHRGVLRRVGDRIKITEDLELKGFDGRVIGGSCLVDRSRFSGESSPIRISYGDTLEAGTTLLQVEGACWVEITSVGASTRLSQILEKMTALFHAQSIHEKFSDRLAKGLLVVVMLIAISAVVLGLMFKGTAFAPEILNRVLALLIVTCPCALALATPLVFSLASQSLVSRGIVIKNPEVLDELLKVREIAFDKTGTLTTGTLVVSELLRSSNSSEEASLSAEEVNQIFSVTQHSLHPVSKSMTRYLHEHYPNLTPLPAAQLEETPGKGVLGKFLNSNGMSIIEIKNTLEHERITASVFINAKLRVIFLFQDQLRDATPSTLQDLKKWGYRLSVLTGDSLKSAEKTLASIPTELKIHAALSPEQKSEYVKSHLCILLGDGLNDALALQEARVGIAVHGGLETAQAVSDGFFLKPGISSILDLITVAKRVRSTLFMNFLGSTSYNLVGGTLALLGYMNPLVAAVLMPVSATTVFLISFFRFRNLKEIS